MPSSYDLPHIDFSRRLQVTPYTSPNSNPGGAGVERERGPHGQRLRNELAAAYLVFDQERPTDQRLPLREGVFLEVELVPGTPVETLERKSAGFQVGASNVQEDRARTVGLFVPDGSRDVLDDILREYQEGDLTDAGNPQRKNVVEPIQAIRRARLETYWTDEPDMLPPAGQQIWWEVWCSREREAQIESMIEALEARTGDRETRLYFPEQVVLPVLADRATIELMLFAQHSIVELRRASDSPSFFLDDLNRDEQVDFATDLAERIEWPGRDVPAVCLLDTGVNRAHVLLEPALASSDMMAVKAEWGVTDTPSGHGTGMAGLALFGDLTPLLASAQPLQLGHRLESVKLLPPDGFELTNERFYGSITKQAVALSEIQSPDRRRVFCMAVTNDGRSGIRPSTWSAALDQEAAGFVAEGEPRSPRRLFIVSAGNAPNHIEMSQISDADSLEIEDPAQAWNVVSVGGFTDLVNIQEPNFAGYTPFAPAGDISPYSRTSTLWLQGKAPFKPDIVMEAGNRVVSPALTDVYDADSLALLSTGPNTDSDPLVSFRATSAATAQAARLAARLMSELPDLWPETIRALLIHGAQWSPLMLQAMAAAPNKQAASALLRRYGHGIPNFERCAASATNHLALISQAEIQPFKRAGSGGMNECHFYSLPWPKATLEQLGDQDVTVKVTLSYFVDPSPAASAVFDQFRYQSHGLRFDLKRRLETTTGFGKRVNKRAWDGPQERPVAVSDFDNWRFGANATTAGSLHSDEWTGPAVNLLSRDMICVKPVGGWWNNRAGAAVRAQTTRYALVISLKSNDETIDLHTPISALVENRVEIDSIVIPT